MSEDIVRFMGKKGTIELLCNIDSGGITFTELLENIRVSRSTLEKRLKEGERWGLWDQRVGDREQRKSHDYYLLDLGELLKQLVQHHQLPQIQTELLEKEKEFNRQKGAVIQMVDEQGLEYLNSVFYEDDS